MKNTLEHIPTEILQVVSPEQAWHYHIIPFEVGDDKIGFYSYERKFDESMEEELEMLFNRKIQISFQEEAAIRSALGRFYRKKVNDHSQAKKASIKTNSNDFLEQLLEEAKELGSSDIHIEPYEKKCRIRLRIDGVLIERFQLSRDQFPALVNKIKIKSNLDIAEKRLPQDGRIFFEQNGHKFDIRVSSLPTLHGEKMVLRLLGGSGESIDIQSLGFKKNDLEEYLEGVRKPNGMVLISGPTGSGKTTTLYATLQLLNQIERNVLTIEDPIEYTLEGINQVQLKEAIGLNFASTMRTFLRQDPDVIMVGEIRDVDTANMAIRASLTGHLVLSTIHTNSAWGIVPRLIDMGVPAYLLADTLNAAVAQRLVRLLCQNCRQQEPFDKRLLPRNYKLQKPLSQHFKSVGCETCHYTGFKGRKAVYEVIIIEEDLSDAIKNQELNVKEMLERKKVQRLAQNAFELFEKGETSIAEVYPILASSG